MESSERDKLIAKGELCPYCLVESELSYASELPYGRPPGRIRICPECGAYVYCHPGTETAMGRLADANLRKLRLKAHEWFDAIWKNKLKKSRYNAYSWLSLRLGMNKDEVHIGLFNEEQCRRVIDICQRYIVTHKPEVIARTVEKRRPRQKE